MELRTTFDEWGRSINDLYTNSRFLLNGWEDFEGVVWPRKKIDILLGDIVGKTELNEQDIVIDIGCGSGWISYALGNSCKTIYSIDVSLEMLRNARIVNPELNVLQCEGAFMPFKDKCIDKAICYFVIMNITDEEYIRNMFSEAVRLLNKGGAALFGQMPEEIKSKDHDEAKVKYRQYLLTKYKELNVPQRRRVPIHLFNRQRVCDMLSRIPGIEFILADSFNPYWFEGEPELIDWRFDVIIKKAAG